MPNATAPTPSSPDAQQPLRLDAAERWPYRPREYILRVLWALVWATLWQLSWKCFHFLRPLILRLFGAKTSLRQHITGSVRITRPWDLVMGDRCAIGPRTRFYNLANLTIGRQVVISQDVYICGGTHDYTDPVYPLLRRSVVIGSYVWIAAGAFIGPGVTIGEGAVIGARAVVMKDVEPWTVVAGNPARPVKKRVMRSAAAPPEAS